MPETANHNGTDFSFMWVIENLLRPSCLTWAGFHNQGFVELLLIIPDQILTIFLYVLTNITDVYVDSKPNFYFAFNITDKFV